MSWSLPTYDPCSGNMASISSAEPGGIETSFSFEIDDNVEVLVIIELIADLLLG